MPKQKFKTGATVRVADQLRKSMAHFPKGFVGVVRGTYATEYGSFRGDEFKKYSLYVIEKGKVINTISWYDENQLRLCKEQKDWTSEIEDFISRS
jgi:hypothetical protein